MISNDSSSIRQNHHKNRKLLIILSILLTVFIIIPVFVAGWLGFVPGLSNILGSREARDLGVRYSESDLTSLQQKGLIEFKNFNQAPVNPINPNERTAFGPLTTVNNKSITQEELSALANDIDWNWFPVKDVQVRLSQGIIEISGYVNSENLDNFANYISNSGNSSDNIRNAINWADTSFTKDMPFYVKASSSVDNNQLSFRLIEAEIGRLNVPLGSLGDDLSNGVSGINIGSDKLNIQSAELYPQNLLVTGTYPAEIYIRQ